jgi:hypothetical protein
MADLNEEILEYLSKNDMLDTLQYAKLRKLEHQKVIGAVKSLQTFEDVSYC